MKTINLRTYRTHPQAPLFIFFGILGILVVLNLLTARPQEGAKTAFIYILATPVPTAPLSTADATRLERENAVLRARIAELETRRPTVAPAPVYEALTVQEQPTPAGPGYVAQTDQGPVFVPDSATPVPEGTTYTGPFLQPQIPAPSGPRVCTGFGDWRDFDAAYETSPACHK